MTSLPLPVGLTEEPVVSDAPLNPNVVELVFPLYEDRCYVTVPEELRLGGLIIPGGTKGIQALIHTTTRARFNQGRWEFLVEFIGMEGDQWVTLASLKPSIWAVLA